VRSPISCIMDMGGHGLYASAGEFVNFLRMILNDSVGPNGRVLQEATVRAMCRDGLPSSNSPSVAGPAPCPTSKTTPNSSPESTRVGVNRS